MREVYFMFDCRGKEIYLICGANGYTGNDGGSIKYTEEVCIQRVGFKAAALSIV